MWVGPLHTFDQVHGCHGGHELLNHDWIQAQRRQVEIHQEYQSRELHHQLSHSVKECKVMHANITFVIRLQWQNLESLNVLSLFPPFLPLQNKNKEDFVWDTWSGYISGLNSGLFFVFLWPLSYLWLFLSVLWLFLLFITPDDTNHILTKFQKGIFLRKKPFASNHVSVMYIWSALVRSLKVDIYYRSPEQEQPESSVSQAPGAAKCYQLH